MSVGSGGGHGSGTVLVTGAAGFLGRHLTRELLGRGASVVAFDIAAARLEALADAGATTVAGDLARWNDVLDACVSHGVRRIFHCGALLSALAEAEPTAAYRANADGTYHVLEVARILDLDRVVFTSTMATFGRGAGDPVADDAPQWPTTIYGATKVFGERLVEYHHRRYGLDARGVRFPSVVGHGRGGTGASGYTSLAFDEPACGRPYALPVGADVRCQLMHVDDAVRALLELDAAPDRDLSRRIYNIAGIAPSAAEVVAAVTDTVPDAELTFVPDDGIEAIVGSWPLRLDDRDARGDWGWSLELDVTGVARRVAEQAGEQR